MRRFLTTLFLFLLPFLVIFVPSCYVLYQSGEFYSLGQVVSYSLQHKEMLYSPAYSNYRQFLQQQATAQHQPAILALGNSRVGEFRAAFFKDPTVFYNATGATASLSDYTNFLHSLEPYHPQILIINLDHYIFDPIQDKNNLVIRPNSFISNPSLVVRHRPRGPCT